MSDVGARPRWRDGVLLVLLAAVIIGGLVHYGRGFGGRDEPAEVPSAQVAGTRSPSVSPAATTSTPSADETAGLVGSEDPPAATQKRGATCWDGRRTKALKLCGLPEGAQGLGWVFPSFARDRFQCQPADQNADSYPIVESYACFQWALGQPITITYDEVKDPTQIEQWLVDRVGDQHLVKIPGAHGGRRVFQDGATKPARITGLYGKFPYVVSVYAPSPEAATRAWRTIVKQRPPQAIRGVRLS